MPFSKNGSIPKPETDGTEGWIQVDDPNSPFVKPLIPEGKEVVWWYPPGWVIRDPKPDDEEGFVWKWSQSSEQWVKYKLPVIGEIVTSNNTIESVTSGDISSLTTSQISSI